MRPCECGDPGPLQVCGDRGGLELRNPVLGVGRGGDASRQLPPVVEDARDVLDAGRSLGQPQHQLVVLDPVERGVRPARSLDERAAHAEEVADVHHPTEELGRPVGLEEGLAPPAAPIELVLVGVDDVRPRLLVEAADALEQRIRVELVVVVEKRDELACGGAQRPVRRRRDPAVLAMAHRDRRVAVERA